jgi:hypothetical protein
MAELRVLRVVKFDLTGTCGRQQGNAIGRRVFCAQAQPEPTVISESLKGLAFLAFPVSMPPTRLSFTPLVNTDRNHFGNDRLYISALEIFGNLVQCRPPLALRF